MEGSLPDSVIWREKKKFREGVGSADQIAAYAARKVSGTEWTRAQEDVNGSGPRPREDLNYYQVVQHHFGESVDPRGMGMTEHVQL